MTQLPHHAQWSDRCSLCHGTHRVGEGCGPFDGHPNAIDNGRALECPWCKAVRMKYGSYYYPIDSSNAHLFKPPKVLHTLTDDELEEIKRQAFNQGRQSATYYGA